MEDKMVLCTATGFSSEELLEYVMDQLNRIAEKTHYESLDDERFNIMSAAFDSADVQAVILETKVHVKVPEIYLKAFNVKPVSWKAEIPYSTALCAIDRELDNLRRRYGLDVQT